MNKSGFNSKSEISDLTSEFRGEKSKVIEAVDAGSAGILARPVLDQMKSAVMRSIPVRASQRLYNHHRLMVLALLVIAIATMACGRSANACPVCNMKVKPSDPWSAEIIYKDGSKLMFESPGDLMTFYSAPDRFDVTDAQADLSNADRIVVKDYNTRSPLDARQARFVHQSKINGPMGRDLVPFADESAALTFVETNGGTVIRFEQVTPEMVRNLRRN